MVCVGPQWVDSGSGHHLSSCLLGKSNQSLVCRWMVWWLVNQKVEQEIFQNLNWKCFQPCVTKRTTLAEQSWNRLGQTFAAHCQFVSPRQEVDTANKLRTPWEQFGFFLPFSQVRKYLFSSSTIYVQESRWLAYNPNPLHNSSIYVHCFVWLKFLHSETAALDILWCATFE